MVNVSSLLGKSVVCCPIELMLLETFASVSAAVCIGSPREEMAPPTEVKGFELPMEMLAKVCPTVVTVEAMLVRLFAMLLVNWLLLFSWGKLTLVAEVK
jgi:hypothetical protein